MLLAKNIPCCLSLHRSEFSHVFCFLLIPVNLSSACTISYAMFFLMAFQFTSTSPYFKPTHSFSFLFFPPISSASTYILLMLDPHHCPWDQFVLFGLGVYSKECQEGNLRAKQSLTCPCRANSHKIKAVLWWRVAITACITYFVMMQQHPYPPLSSFPQSATQACLLKSHLRKDLHIFPNPKKVEQKLSGTEGWADCSSSSLLIWDVFSWSFSLRGQDSKYRLSWQNQKELSWRQFTKTP